MASMPKISPRDAKALIDQGAVLVDIRESDERARAQIAGSPHMPLSKLGSLGNAPAGKGQVVVFHCKSGNRQVMIVAGSMVLAGVLLGISVSPLWFYLSAFVGLGLVFSGVTGFCLMAYMLKRMPWNRGYA